MFDELVELGRQLEGKQDFPLPGFYYYSKTSPLRWIVNYWPDRVYLEESSEEVARPFSGRTSGIEAHFLVDEAAYALGVAKQKGEASDKHATRKHEHFVDLLRAYVDESQPTDPELVDAVRQLIDVLASSKAENDPRFGEIESKQWVAFVPATGPLTGQKLFELDAARDFWTAEMARRCASHENGDASPEIVGTCSVCGQAGVKLVGKLPLKVKLTKTSPIHSLNQNAFTSYIAGAGTSKRAHLGICFVCGDSAARAFNYLSNSRRHRKPLYPSEQNEDGLSNSIALYWLKGPGELVIESSEHEETTFDFDNFDQTDLIAPIETREDPAKLGHLRRLLDVPWRPADAALSINDFAFVLGIVSPNVGRLAVRDWFSVSIEEMKEDLKRYLDATRTIEADGSGESSASVGTIAEAIGTEDTNLIRSLLHTAYTGTPPPASLVVMAGQRLNYLLPLERDLRERQLKLGFDKKPVWGPRWSHALAAAIRLGLGWKPKEEPLATNADLERDIGFQCGRLLALLEEAQQIYTWRQYGDRLKTSLVQHAYGGASTTPGAVLSRLMRQAATAHLPKATARVRDETGAVCTRIAEIGQIPEALTPLQQAQFGLGFFTQRAEIRSWSKQDRALDAPGAIDPDDELNGGTSIDEEETE